MLTKVRVSFILIMIHCNLSNVSFILIIIHGNLSKSKFYINHDTW